MFSATSGHTYSNVQFNASPYIGTPLTIPSTKTLTFTPTGGYTHSNVQFNGQKSSSIPTYGFTHSTPLQIANGAPPATFQIQPSDSPLCSASKTLTNIAFHNAFQPDVSSNLGLLTSSIITNTMITDGMIKIKANCN